MGARRGRHLHAVRVATVATVVVMASYVIAVIALNLFVAHRLTAQADSRLAQSLATAKRSTLQFPGAEQPSGDQDPDDAPRFVWSVAGSGQPTALTPGSPLLPSRSWSAGASTIEVNGTPFRFQAQRSHAGLLIAGQSMAQLVRVRSALLAPELLFGAALLVVVFVGSLIIGLRASAPLELVHRRQVEFTADASHELRTPLSVIQAELGLALNRPRTPEDYRTVLRRISDESDRLGHIVDDLLWLARIDDERSAVRSEEETDVASIAEASTERFQAIAAARQVTIHVAVAEGQPAQIHADPSWIDRLVGVLVDNACKFAGPGGRVDVSVRTVGNRVLLRVDDSGPGIPQDQRLLVFDRFHRGTNDSGGTGLGLAIADSVVRATEGTCSIGDAPSGGARMEVSWRNTASSRARDADLVLRAEPARPGHPDIPDSMPRSASGAEQPVQGSPAGTSNGA
ncbi:MAG: sensor histidine kinase [Acidimicrobiales bacterium]